ncbi:MAG: 30S ribosomal protein S15 [Thermoplasmata archaeon]|jgi:small subunit ribosomal protein S15|nr:30S ribosomal protein S15 [Thermoplasmata archaeon]MVT13827.1 30S ribosomal protein S15 [Euryarchaeota archaeon]MVT14168.1 30S ribosomal protein S15 [Euryarchaeota archaeon]MVT36380.1 30S ribosomal protein S15 [Euryarchaeota archaeon]
MSRLHSSKHGRSGSKIPVREGIPQWALYKGKDAEQKLIELIKQGNTMSRAGILLRDVYGVPRIRAVTGKKMLKILKENNLEPKIPEDLLALMRKAVNLNNHLKKNPKDLSNLRGLHLIESKIMRLVRYYKRTGRLPQNWKYSLETAELLTK